MAKLKTNEQKKDKSLLNLDNTISTLLGENGCPWDKVQTHDSLKNYLIEECYETIDAIDSKDETGLCEELGDVLFQIMFHAKLKELEGKFDINDVINTVNKKMVERHPHVFGDKDLKTEEELHKSWEQIKKIEKKYKSDTEVLRCVPKALPALMRASNVAKKASRLQENILNINDLFNQSKELLCNIEKDKNDNNIVNLEEFGQLLFDLTAISTKLQINAEFALTNATEKFINRFEYTDNVYVSELLKDK